MLCLPHINLFATATINHNKPLMATNCFICIWSCSSFTYSCAALCYSPRQTETQVHFSRSTHQLPSPLLHTHTHTSSFRFLFCRSIIQFLSANVVAHARMWKLTVHLHHFGKHIFKAVNRSLLLENIIN